MDRLAPTVSSIVTVKMECRVMCLLEDVKRAVSRGGQEKAVKVKYRILGVSRGRGGFLQYKSI